MVVTEPPVLRRLLQAVDYWEAPLQNWRWALYTLAATAIGRRAGVKYMGRPLYPNILAVLIGEPSTKKSTVLTTMSGFLHEAGFDKVIKDAVTYRSMCTSLKTGVSNSVKIKPASSGAAMLFGDVDAPDDEIDFSTAADQPDAEALFLADEFAEMFLAVKGSHNTLKAIQILWDCPDKYDSPYGVLTRPIVNLLAATNTQKISQIFSSLTDLQGFASRTILVGVEPTGRRFDPFGVTFNPQIEDELISLFRWMLALRDEEVTFDAEARQMAASIRMHIHPNTVSDDARLKSYLSRRDMHIVKMSMLTALLDKRFVVTAADVGYAHTLLAYTESHMSTAIGEYGNLQSSDLLDAIKSALSASPNGMTSRSMLRSVKSYARHLSELTPALTSLVETGAITIDRTTGIFSIARTGIDRWRPYFGQFIFPETVKEWRLIT